MRLLSPTLRHRILLALILAFAGVGPSSAQEMPPPNGYPELVRAGNLLQSSKLFQDAVAGNTTLRQKRLALADKPVREALAVLRPALSKVVFSPKPATAQTLPLQDLNSF